MKVNEHQVRAFNAACRYRSFSKAATALGVTQSSVTQNVAKLEIAIGARLFERRRSGLALTPAGSKIFAITEEIGLLHTLLEARMGEFAKLDRGTLRIVATTSRPTIRYMKRFKERFPGVELIFEHASWRACAEYLRTRDADVALMPEPEDLDGLYVQPIEERAHTALVYRGHGLADENIIDLRDLAGEPMIFTNTRSFARWRVEQAAAEEGIRFSNTMNVASAPMAVEAVHHELGITVGYENADMPEIFAAFR